jgi:hypothetical protein
MIPAVPSTRVDENHDMRCPHADVVLAAIAVQG